MAKKAYIINITHGAWNNQLWFSGEDDDLTERKWVDAKKSLEEVGSQCSNSNKFFSEAVKHFEEYGFVRVQK